MEMNPCNCNCAICNCVPGEQLEEINLRKLNLQIYMLYSGPEAIVTIVLIVSYDMYIMCSWM